jgi:hypothetical protein
MPDYDFDQISSVVEERLRLERLRLPSQFLVINDTITDDDGGRDILERIWQHPNSDLITLVAVSLGPLSGSGQYRSDGANVTDTQPGIYIPAGGGMISLYTRSDIRFFRIRADAGATMYLTAAAYRAGAR